MSRHSQQQGFVALIALLVVAAAGLTIGLTVSLAGIDELQSSYGQSQALKARAVASACVEEGLEQLRRNWANDSRTLSIGPDSCILTTVTSAGSATVAAIGTVGIYQHKIQVTVDSGLEVTAWQEE